MEHSLQISQQINHDALALGSPRFIPISPLTFDQLIVTLIQQQAQFRSNLRMDPLELDIDQSSPNQGLQLHEASLTSQSPSITFQVNRQKRQEFVLELESILKSEFKDKKTKLRKRKCLKTYDCSICQQKIRRKSMIYQLKCKHIYHAKCLDNWRAKKNNCPLCRRELI